MKKIQKSIEEYISVSCLQIEQPIGKFYLGVIDSADLIRISYSDVRRIEKPKLDTYLGIQRRIVPKRIDEIERYLNLPDATFPTNIIISITSDDAIFDERSKVLRIRDRSDVAKIIDGQHRIAGLGKQKQKNFEVGISVFVDMDIEEQAFVFSSINLAQTHINRSLVYDLYEYAKSKSPQKTAHNIARLLNTKEKSPLYNQISILGTAHSNLKLKRSLTQATVVETILEMISGSVEQANHDRDNIKRGTPLIEIKEASLIFRDRFINGKDAEIALIVWNYLGTIKRKWPVLWDEIGMRGSVSDKKIYKPLMRLLPLIYKQFALNIDIPTENDFWVIVNRINFKSLNFNRKLYFQGKTGEDKLFNDLSKAFAIAIQNRHLT